MEREYTIGALLILVVIFVIALIIYFTVPEFNTEIKNIADEVFGISIKAKQAEEEFYEQEQAKRVLESVRKCVEQLKKSKEGCTCYLEYTDLPKEYSIELTEDFNEFRLVKGNLRVADTENIKDVKNKFCILKKDFTGSPWEGFLTINSKSGKLGVNTKEFIDNTPQFYNIKEGNNSLMCFITNDFDEEEAKKIREINNCEDGKNLAKENMLKFFNEFITMYERCKKYKGKGSCLCDPVDFNNLLDGYEIFVQQDIQNKETKFSLYYTRDQQPKLVDEKLGVKTVYNNIFGFDDTELPEGKTGYLKEWQSSAERFLGVLWVRYKVFIQLVRGERIYLKPVLDPTEEEKCAPEYAICKGCKIPTNKEIMLKRLRGEDDKGLYTYKGTTYKKLIEDLVTDPYMRLLVASIIPVESEFYNEAEGKDPKTGKVVDKGLMQFNEKTAPGFPKEKDWKCPKSQCFVCSKPDLGGCNTGKDDRKDPYIAIPAAAQLLKENLQQFEGYTDKELFAIAAYNAGPSTIRNAIKETGEQDPSWSEVMKEIENDFTPCYPCKVEYYKKAFEQEFLQTSSVEPVKENTATQIFEDVVSKFEKCFTTKITESCMCDNSEVNLEKLPEGYIIKIERDSTNKYSLVLYYQSKYIQDKVININIGLFSEAEKDLNSKQLGNVPPELCNEGLGFEKTLSLDQRSAPFSLFYNIDSRFYLNPAISTAVMPTQKSVTPCTVIQQDMSGKYKGVYMFSYTYNTASRTWYPDPKKNPVLKYCSGTPVSKEAEEEIEKQEEGKQKETCEGYGEDLCYNNLNKCYPYFPMGNKFSRCEYCKEGIKCADFLSEKACKLNPCGKTCEWQISRVCLEAK